MFLEFISKDILERSQELELKTSSDSCHQAIKDALDKSVLQGGKRLRPLLTYSMAKFINLDLEQADVAAKSIEMVHAASLSHDDVIDEASTRRGDPSINIQQGNKKAVLSGDYLLANVIYDLSNFGNLILVKEMAKVIRMLAEGEWIQSDALKNRDYSQEVLNQICLRKTASVMGFCCSSPLIIKGASSTLVDVARSFGETFGLCFQMIDDVIDFSQESQKDLMIDLENNQVNFVSYHWLTCHQKEYERYLKGERLSNIIDPSSVNPSINFVRNEARELGKKAKDSLAVLSQSFENNSDPLEKLIDAVITRTL